MYYVVVCFLCMSYIAGYASDRNSYTISRIVFFVGYIEFSYAFKQRVGYQPCAVLVGIGKNNGKFFSAISCGKIIRP